MSEELKAAVERLGKECAHHGYTRSFAEHVTDLRLVLASLQAPCPGKAGELTEERLAAIIADRVEIVDVLGEQEIMGSTEAARAILALLSAQPVPGELP